MNSRNYNPKYRSQHYNQHYNEIGYNLRPNQFSFSYPFANNSFRNNRSNSNPEFRRFASSFNDIGYCRDNRSNPRQNQPSGQRYWNPSGARPNYWKQRIRFDRRFSLSDDIKRLYIEKKQSEYIDNRKMNLRKMVWNELQCLYDVRVITVGSSSNGLATIYSELDICVIFKENGPDTMNALELICELLNKKDFVKNKRLIPAKVPILKFIDAISGTVVNVNVNNRTCTRNTILIKLYTGLDERIGPLMVAMKIWARQNGINDASNKTLNGYTLTLMVINFLQRCSPPVLPCLHNMMPNDLDVNLDKNWRDLYIQLSNNFQSPNQESIGELFMQFLHYYGFEFDFRLNVVSVRIGSVFSKSELLSSNKNELTQWKYIAVEEPFDLTNTARSVNEKIAFDYILDVFKFSYRTLAETQNLSTII